MLLRVSKNHTSWPVPGCNRITVAEKLSMLMGAVTRIVAVAVPGIV